MVHEISRDFFLDFGAVRGLTEIQWRPKMFQLLLKNAELLLQTDHFWVWVFPLGLFFLQNFSHKKMDVCGISV